VAAVLFDEMQHAKPGEDSALAVRSGLFQTQGPAQLSVGEMVKQGLLPDNATPEQILDARQAGQPARLPAGSVAHGQWPSP
jgi:hypothetical protein